MFLMLTLWSVVDLFVMSFSSFGVKAILDSQNVLEGTPSSYFFMKNL